jgi:ABC-type Fe3+-siderophore transport system permease subunit
MENDLIGTIATWTTAFTGPAGALLILIMMIWDRKYKVAPAWHRYGLAFLAVGMVGQAARSWMTIMTGVSPRDSEMPWWVFKDIGIFTLAASWMVLAMIAARRKQKPQNKCK